MGAWVCMDVWMLCVDCVCVFVYLLVKLRTFGVLSFVIWTLEYVAERREGGWEGGGEAM